MTEYRVPDVLRRDIPRLSADMPIRRAVGILMDSNAAVAPVLLDNGQMIGILSQKDCFGPALHASYHREWTGRVADRMSSDVVSVQIDEEIIHLAEMFLSYPHRVFPVLDGTDVAGLVHRSDVLRLLLSIG